MYLYDIREEDFTRLTYFGFQPLIRNGAVDDIDSFNGEYIVVGEYIYDVRDKVNQDSERIVTVKYGNDNYREEVLGEVYGLNHFRKRNVDCIYTGESCKEDVQVSFGGNIIQNDYLIGGGTILNIKAGDYYIDIPSYKQVSGTYALEYNLKWGLENLAYVDLNKKPIFYAQPVPKEILSQFDSDYSVLGICLEEDDGYCIKIIVGLMLVSF